MTDGPMSFLKRVGGSSEKCSNESSDVEHRGRKPRDAESLLPSDFLQTLGQYLMGQVHPAPTAKTDTAVKSGVKAGAAALAPQALSALNRHRNASAAHDVHEKRENCEVRAHRGSSEKLLEQQEKLAQLPLTFETNRVEPSSGSGSVAESNGAKAALFTNPAIEDPSLRLAVMPQSARINIEAGGAGDLSLHLRIKDGVADIRFEGSAVPVFEPRAEELRVVLATEGISLGSFDVSSDGNSKHEQAYQAQEAVTAAQGRVPPRNRNAQSDESTRSGTLDNDSESRRSGLVNIKA